MLFVSFVLNVALSQMIQNNDIIVKLPSNVTMQVKLPKWKPKTTTDYDPSRVDWNGVISGCRAACRFDRRLCNFYIRAAAHDSLSVSEGFGGADGSVILTDDEIKRPENRYDSFVFLLSKNALALAKRYNTSVADIVAVCGAVSVQYQGGPTIIQYNTTHPFLVGRYDRITPNPNTLAPANSNTMQFASFAESRNLTIEEMTALMGSHSLIDHTGCERTNGSQCNPYTESCTDLRMFKWSNKFFRDACSPRITINIPAIKSTLPLKTLEELVKENMCKFTSPEFRQRQVDLFTQEIKLLLGDIVPDALVIDLDTEMETVSWFGPKSIARRWLYTLNDAWLGLACQNKLETNEVNTRIGAAMNTFRTNTRQWDSLFTQAYKKMMNIGADFSVPGGFAITGDECPSGYVPAIKGAVVDCSKCTEQFRINGTYSCPNNCKCKTAIANSVKFYQ